MSATDQAPDDSLRLKRVEERVDELEEQVGDNHVGALFETMLDRIISIEEENKQLKKVVGELCNECDRDVREIIFDEDSESSDVEEFL